ncbi:chymotrypsin-1-like isoform X2 [Zophobas morio]|uniref:chymotrypsin-1-like isoform X2 n=1 Tax=Zophobas morio TaxID=2755281 RepID=UPI003083E94A
MDKSVGIFLTVLIVCISTLAEPLDDRIFGGQLATLGQFPSIVSIKTGPGIIGDVCGASIITKQWVATAAHCVSDSAPDDIFLLADTLLLDSGGTNYSVSSIVVHPEYYRYTYTNDIALIKLQTEFTLSATTQTIEIDTSSGNESCTIVGWGKIRATYPDALYYANLTALTDDDCTRMAQGGAFVIERGPGQLCAFAAQGIGPCYGDSGGPLICVGKLIGMASYAISPCAKGYPDVYTRIAYYVDWINDVIAST